MRVREGKGRGRGRKIKRRGRGRGREKEVPETHEKRERVLRHNPERDRHVKRKR